MLNFFYLLATFTSPEEIGTDPKSMLWFIPLSASIAFVYKATKLEKITARSFAKEAIVLTGSIVGFMIICAIILLAATWLITE